MMTLDDVSTWSRIPGKLDVFLQDAGFLYACATLQAAKGTALLRGLPSSTYALFKPDAFAFGKAVSALDYLLAHGFAVTSHYALQLTEAQMLGLWRYQWNRATPERIAASLSIGALGPSILAVLQDQRSVANGIPAAPRLWSLKGSASAKGRSPDRLRSVLDVRGRYFGYVHVPDEPADVVRELAWLLGTHAMLCALTPVDTSSEHLGCALRARLVELENLFRLPWAAHNPPRGATDISCEAAGRIVMNGYAELRAPDFPSSCRDARQEAWLRVAAAAPMLQDNREGVHAIIESGGITDPESLWHTGPQLRTWHSDAPSAG